jgi:hypothetical protein
VRFAGALASALGARVDACQAPGDPDVALCGETNVEGRLTNGVDAGAACTRGTSASSGRFVHLEQDRALGTNEWTHVRDVTTAIWPACERTPGCARPEEIETPDVACP